MFACGGGGGGGGADEKTDRRLTGNDAGEEIAA